jgi:hypothetical protein
VTSSSSEQVTVSNSQSTSAAFQSGTMSPVALAVIGTAIIATIAIASILYVRSKSLRKK